MSGTATTVKVQPLINLKKLAFYIAKGYNVCFKGSHGVGKTGAVMQAFKEAGLVWGDTAVYFSAPTLDPWVDLVGIPRKVTVKTCTMVPNPEKDGELMEQWADEDLMEILAPKRMKNVKAIFIDEFNRAHKKVKNALMELIQFRSINGISYPNLRLVWIAINPDDEEGTYDVEPMDPAQLDRFQVHINVETKPCPHYFITRFGQQGKALIDWWEELSKEQKSAVSPRRLEYVMRMHKDDGDIRDVLPPNTNVTKLLDKLKDGPMLERLMRVHDTKDEEDARRIMEDPNLFEDAIPHISRVATGISFFFQFCTTEQIGVAMSKHAKIADYVVRDVPNVPIFKEAVRQILVSNANQELVGNIKTVAARNGVDLSFAQKVTA